MNRSKKIRQMRRFIDKYGFIEREYKRDPDKFYRPYRKGSYFASFFSHAKPGYSILCGDVDRYCVYKSLIESIKENERVLAELQEDGK